MKGSNDSTTNSKETSNDKKMTLGCMCVDESQNF